MPWSAALTSSEAVGPANRPSASGAAGAEWRAIQRRRGSHALAFRYIISSIARSGETSYPSFRLTDA